MCKFLCFNSVSRIQVSSLKENLSFIFVASKVCKMACRPVGAGFYLELGSDVPDGTPCGDEDNQVCISGQCRVCICLGTLRVLPSP